MKVKTKSLKVGVLAALCTALFSASAMADVKIGVINSLSGNFAAFGQRYNTGMQVALEEINAKGGINGEKVELIIQDDRSEAQSALAAVESLNKQQVPLIIGSYASGITGPVSKVATRQKIPLIVLGSADDSITKPGSDWVFRAKHNSTIVAKAYFDYFDNLRKNNPEIKKIAVMYGNGAWPTSMSEEGIRQAEKRGYEIVGKQAYDQGTTDFRPILNKFRAANPDILLTSSYADDGIAIARQIKEVGLNTKVVAIDTASSMVSFIQQVGNPSENIVSAVTWSPDVKYEGTPELYERLKKKAKEDPSFYEAEGYLALTVAADALRRAKSLDRDAVRDALTKTDLKTPVTDVTFENYDGFKGQNPIKSVIIQIQNGKHVTVFPENLASQKAKFSN
ncbi:ABC transporter substrate-binding protein [Bordetella genomosp. 4]|uniref:ABC transporter substrate-binding protein n=1 Tax=Bordetella genomosp. 4 TaxID=463044 RepID=UPI001C3CB098|nr:ABC transporter substrate-binding protein [Bordetella genomosp. 4]